MLSYARTVEIRQLEPGSIGGGQAPGPFNLSIPSFGNYRIILYGVSVLCVTVTGCRMPVAVEDGVFKHIEILRY